MYLIIWNFLLLGYWSVDTHEQSSWYFITQASLALNPGALDARRTSVSSPFPPQLWRQNTLATKPHSLSNTAVLTNRTFSLIHYLYAASFWQLRHLLHIWAGSPSRCVHDLPVDCISLSHIQEFLLLSSEKVLLDMHWLQDSGCAADISVSIRCDTPCNMSRVPNVDMSRTYSITSYRHRIHSPTCSARGALPFGFLWMQSGRWLQAES